VNSFGGNTAIQLVDRSRRSSRRTHKPLRADRSTDRPTGQPIGRHSRSRSLVPVGGCDRAIDGPKRVSLSPFLSPSRSLSWVEPGGQTAAGLSGLALRGSAPCARETRCRLLPSLGTPVGVAMPLAARKFPLYQKSEMYIFTHRRRRCAPTRAQSMLRPFHRAGFSLLSFLFFQTFPRF